jgi:hypothetical protein
MLLTSLVRWMCTGMAGQVARHRCAIRVEMVCVVVLSTGSLNRLGRQQRYGNDAAGNTLGDLSRALHRVQRRPCWLHARMQVSGQMAVQERHDSSSSLQSTALQRYSYFRGTRGMYKAKKALSLRRKLSFHNVS